MDGETRAHEGGGWREMSNPETVATLRRDPRGGVSVRLVFAKREDNPGLCDVLHCELPSTATLGPHASGIGADVQICAGHLQWWIELLS